MTRIIIGLFLLSMITACDSGGSSGGGPLPVVSPTILVTGSIVLPAGSTLDPTTLTVDSSFDSQSPDSNGDVSLTVIPNGTRILTAFTNTGTPFMFQVAESFSTSTNFQLDSQSTAESLIFFYPTIARFDQALVPLILTTIRALPETITLQNLIATKLSANPDVLGAPDIDIQNALDAAARAFFIAVRTESYFTTASVAPPLIVAPTGPASGVTPISIAQSFDTNGDIEVTFENTFNREVQLFITPPNTPPSGSQSITLDARPSLFDPSQSFPSAPTTSIKLPLRDTTQLAVRVHGIGLTEGISDPQNDSLRPTIINIVNGTISPLLSASLGLELDSKSAFIRTLVNSLAATASISVAYNSALSTESWGDFTEACFSGTLTFLAGSQAPTLLQIILDQNNLTQAAFFTKQATGLFIRHHFIPTTEKLTDGLLALKGANRSEEFVFTNQLPSVNVQGPTNLTAMVNDSITLQATGSDPEQNALTLTWTQSQGPNVPLNITPGTNSADLQITFPSAGSYVFEVSSNDGAQDSTTIQVTILVS